MERFIDIKGAYNVRDIGGYTTQDGAIGRIEKLTRNFAFLSADLYNSKHIRTASLTSTAKVSYQKERD